MADEIISTPSVTGNAEGTAPQGTEKTPQGGNQPQGTEQVKVDNPQQEASNQDGGGGPKPASYFSRQREREKQYQSTITEQRKMLERMDATLKEVLTRTQQPAPAAQKPAEQTEKIWNEKLYWDEPLEWQKQFAAMQEEKLTNAILEKIRKNEIPNFISQESQKQDFQRKELEALDLIFPKKDPKDADKWESRRDADPEYRDRVLKIMKETGLDILSETQPIKAARAVVEIYNVRYPKTQAKSSNALPNKGALASTATGSP